jgi:undecaprenyl-diphosphatase
LIEGSYMNILFALILGIIEGLTEFVPVSSTAHMLIAQKLFNIPSNDGVFAFLVLVQLGPLLALLIYFWRDYLQLIKAFFARPFSTPENRMAWYIIIATIPAGLAGILLKDVVEGLFQNPLIAAAIRLVSAAILLFLGERFGRSTRKLETMTWLDSLVIGLFQVLAVIPGASRSGSTIPGGMLRNFDRKSATRFAFLMAAPIMLAAGGYESLSVIRQGMLSTIFAPLAVGFIVAAVVGWLSIRWLINYVGKHSLYVFAAYCWVVALIALVLNFI